MQKVIFEVGGVSLISITRCSIEIFKYLYSEFSFPLLIMGIIIIFYKQIKIYLMI